LTAARVLEHRTVRCEIKPWRAPGERLLDLARVQRTRAP